MTGERPQGKTNLMTACEQGRTLEAKIILQKKPQSIATRDRHGKTALHYCAESGALACAQMLLGGVDQSLLDAPDSEGFTPLHLAVISGHRAIAKLLLRSGADPDSVDKERHSAVHWAAVCGDTESLDLLLSQGASPSTPDILGAYPIHYAAQMCGAHSLNGKDPETGLNTLRKLVQRGASVQCRDKDGREPILWAASAGSSEAVLVLFTAGANVAASDKDGLTALHCAASRGHTGCVETLITLCGTRVDSGDHIGCTPLFYSAAQGQADCTQILLKHGADPNRQDDKGRTAAHCAAVKGRLEILRILDSNGADLWIRNSRGNLTLHEAVLSGRKDLVQWLLQQCPRAVNATNISGRTPLHIAAQRNNVEMCEVLIDYGAFINPLMVNAKGFLMTPLDASVYQGNQRCAKYLQLHGAVPATKVLENNEINRNLLFSLGNYAYHQKDRSDEEPATSAMFDQSRDMLQPPNGRDTQTRTIRGGQQPPLPQTHVPPESELTNVTSEEVADASVHIHLTRDDLWSLWESLMQELTSEMSGSEVSQGSELRQRVKRKTTEVKQLKPILTNVYLRRESSRSQLIAGESILDRNAAEDEVPTRSVSEDTKLRYPKRVTDDLKLSLPKVSESEKTRTTEEDRRTASSHVSEVDIEEKKQETKKKEPGSLEYLTDSVGSDTEHKSTVTGAKATRLRKRRSDARSWGKEPEESETSSGHRQDQREDNPYLKKYFQKQARAAEMRKYLESQSTLNADDVFHEDYSQSQDSSKKSSEKYDNSIQMSYDDMQHPDRHPGSTRQQHLEHGDKAKHKRDVKYDRDDLPADISYVSSRTHRRHSKASSSIHGDHSNVHHAHHRHLKEKKHKSCDCMKNAINDGKTDKEIWHSESCHLRRRHDKSDRKKHGTSPAHELHRKSSKHFLEVPSHQSTAASDEISDNIPNEEEMKLRHHHRHHHHHHHHRHHHHHQDPLENEILIPDDTHRLERHHKHRRHFHRGPLSKDKSYYVSKAAERKIVSDGEYQRVEEDIYSGVIQRSKSEMSGLPWYSSRDVLTQSPVPEVAEKDSMDGIDRDDRMTVITEQTSETLTSTDISQKEPKFANQESQFEISESSKDSDKSADTTAQSGDVKRKRSSSDFEGSSKGIKTKTKVAKDESSPEDSDKKQKVSDSKVKSKSKAEREKKSKDTKSKKSRKEAKKTGKPSSRAARSSSETLSETTKDIALKQQSQAARIDSDLPEIKIFSVEGKETGIPAEGDYKMSELKEESGISDNLVDSEQQNKLSTMEEESTKVEKEREIENIEEIERSDGDKIKSDDDISLQMTQNKLDAEIPQNLDEAKEKVDELSSKITLNVEQLDSEVSKTHADAEIEDTVKTQDDYQEKEATKELEKKVVSEISKEAFSESESEDDGEPDEILYRDDSMNFETQDTKVVNEALLLNVEEKGQSSLKVISEDTLKGDSVNVEETDINLENNKDDISGEKKEYTKDKQTSLDVVEEDSVNIESEDTKVETGEKELHSKTDDDIAGKEISEDYEKKDLNEDDSVKQDTVTETAESKLETEKGEDFEKVSKDKLKGEDLYEDSVSIEKQDIELKIEESGISKDTDQKTQQEERDEISYRDDSIEKEAQDSELKETKNILNEEDQDSQIPKRTTSQQEEEEESLKEHTVKELDSSKAKLITEREGHEIPMELGSEDKTENKEYIADESEMKELRSTEENVTDIDYQKKLSKSEDVEEFRLEQNIPGEESSYVAPKILEDSLDVPNKEGINIKDPETPLDSKQVEQKSSTAEFEKIEAEIEMDEKSDATLVEETAKIHVKDIILRAESEIQKLSNNILEDNYPPQQSVVKDTGSKKTDLAHNVELRITDVTPINDDMLAGDLDEDHFSEPESTSEAETKFNTDSEEIEPEPDLVDMHLLERNGKLPKLQNETATDLSQLETSAENVKLEKIVDGERKQEGLEAKEGITNVNQQENIFNISQDSGESKDEKELLPREEDKAQAKKDAEDSDLQMEYQTAEAAAKEDIISDSNNEIDDDKIVEKTEIHIKLPEITISTADGKEKDFSDAEKETESFPSAEVQTDIKEDRKVRTEANLLGFTRSISVQTVDYDSAVLPVLEKVQKADIMNSPIKSGAQRTIAIQTEISGIVIPKPDDPANEIKQAIRVANINDISGKLRSLAPESAETPPVTSEDALKGITKSPATLDPSKRSPERANPGAVFYTAQSDAIKESPKKTQNVSAMFYTTAGDRKDINNKSSPSIHVVKGNKDSQRTRQIESKRKPPRPTIRDRSLESERAVAIANSAFHRLNSKGELTVFNSTVITGSANAPIIPAAPFDFESKPSSQRHGEHSNLNKPGFLWVHFGSGSSPISSLKRKPSLSSQKMKRESKFLQSSSTTATKDAEGRDKKHQVAPSKTSSTYQASRRNEMRKEAAERGTVRTKYESKAQKDVKVTPRKKPHADIHDPALQVSSKAITDKRSRRLGIQRSDEISKDDSRFQIRSKIPHKYSEKDREKSFVEQAETTKSRVKKQFQYDSRTKDKIPEIVQSEHTPRRAIPRLCNEISPLKKADQTVTPRISKDAKKYHAKFPVDYSEPKFPEISEKEESIKARSKGMRDESSTSRKRYDFHRRDSFETFNIDENQSLKYFDLSDSTSIARNLSASEESDSHRSKSKRGKKSSPPRKSDRDTAKASGKDISEKMDEDSRKMVKDIRQKDGVDLSVRMTVRTSPKRSRKVSPEKSQKRSPKRSKDEKDSPKKIQRSSPKKSEKGSPKKTGSERQQEENINLRESTETESSNTKGSDTDSIRFRPRLSDTAKSSSLDEGDVRLVIQRKADPEFSIKISMSDKNKKPEKQKESYNTDTTQCESDQSLSCVKDSGYISTTESVQPHKRSITIDLGHTTAKINTGLKNSASSKLDDKETGKDETSKVSFPDVNHKKAPDSRNGNQNSLSSSQKVLPSKLPILSSHRQRSNSMVIMNYNRTPRRNSISSDIQENGEIYETDSVENTDSHGKSFAARDRTPRQVGHGSQKGEGKVSRNGSGIPIYRAQSDSNLQQIGKPSPRLSGQSLSTPSIPEVADSRIPIFERKMDSIVEQSFTSNESQSDINESNSRTSDNVKLPSIRLSRPEEADFIKRHPDKEHFPAISSLSPRHISPAPSSFSPDYSTGSFKLPILQKAVRCRCNIEPHQYWDGRRTKSAVDCVANLHFLTEEELAQFDSRLFAISRRSSYSSGKRRTRGTPTGLKSLRTQTVKRLKSGRKSVESVTFHVDHAKERNSFKLPTSKLRKNKKWQVTFTIAKSEGKDREGSSVKKKS